VDEAQNQSSPLLPQGSSRNLKLWTAIIFGIGLAVRVVFIFITMHTESYGGAEPFQIALSLANHGTYADAYGQGVGPTAHTMPAVPIILAVIIRLAGTGPAEYVIRAVLAAMAAALAFALLPVLAMRCRLGMPVGVTAGLIAAIAPINNFARSGVWDAPYTMLGLTGLCVLLSGYWMKGFFPIRGGISLGALAGALCLFNPAILQVVMGWWIFGVFRFENNRKAFSMFMLTAVAMVLIFLSPWAFRNFRTLGAFIWTRSDFGLELQISNNDRVVADLEKNVSSAELPDPYMQLKEREKVRQMGESAYQQAKKKEALLWIRNHPARFVRLTIRRIFLFWFPPMAHRSQSIAEVLITVFGIGGLVALLSKKNPSSWIFGGVLLFYPAVYSVVEVSPRYRIPI
jgi:hypothetical protein